MTQEDKELLLKDLCSRLPYGIIVETPKGKGHVCDINLTIFGAEIGVNVNPTIRDNFSISYVKPYLFPLSSMTEEQSKVYHELIDGMFGTSALINFEVLTDFFNSNHLDYRGLIKRGLAIDATGLNIY